MDNRPIGVLDSGVGGLTVLREIINKVPHEDMIYFGDTARFPYGPKNLEEVKRFVFKITEFLFSKNVKLIVVACNTASAAALEDLKKNFNIPIIGVIEPGARTAAQNTVKKRVGVIATKGTVKSNAYGIALQKINPEIKLFSSAAPVLVEYIENGVLDGKELNDAIMSYINPLVAENIDVLILGCTHFPLIEKQIHDCCDSRFKVISSSLETSKDIKATLDELKLNCSPKLNIKPVRTFFETGKDSKFMVIGRMFLGNKIINVEKVELEI